MRKTILSLLLSALSSMCVAQENTATSLTGAWTGKLELGPMSLTIVLHFEPDGDTMACTMDSPDQGAKGIATKTEYADGDSVSVAVPIIGMTYRARREADRLNGTFTQNGTTLPLVLTKGTEELRRPQTPTPPYPYTTEEVTLTGGGEGVTLAGTLTYPVGYDRRSKPAVVVMVTGSGLQSRDEELMEHKPFLVIADHLARHGIASLRYDDRGFGASTAGSTPIEKATTADFAADAEAATAFLRSTGRFGQVGVVGHSEGACIAFMLGSKKAADFVVSMAGLGVKADVALTVQANRILQLQGSNMQLTTEQYRSNLLATNNEGWIRWFIDYDPTPDIAATTCPVMAINGDKDCQVVSLLNLTAIGRRLPKNAASLVKEYAGLNHLFQHCQTGLPTEYRNIEETIAQEVLDDMASWIRKVTQQ